MTGTQEFSHDAARRYLQSIVFVDDEIYQAVPSTAMKIDAGGAAAAMRVYAKPIEPKVEQKINAPSDAAGKDKAADQNSGGNYHPKYLVESFARERMVCALYEPQKDFPTDSESEVFKLCERADVVILDWEFYKEPGKKVLELVGGLVSAAQTTVPHHVRLCAIYTSTQNLKHIAQNIYDHLKKQGLGVETDGEYSLNAGSSRIIVLGKPSTGRPKDQVEAAEVAEQYLAERIIREFATMHEGILPSMALHGLASVRTSTKMILDKFHKEMDGAFLAHRGLILPGDDAFEQIPELLAEEALAVMVDKWISSDDAKKLADQAIDAMKIQAALPAKNGGNSEPETFAKLLKEGPGKVRKKVKLDPGTLEILHNELDSSNASAKERLAALYTSRTQYGDERSLEFGTIIRYQVDAEENGKEARYAMCLMPLCDCVRLKQDEWFCFPFWELRADNKGKASKGIVVELPNKADFIELFSMGKPRDQLWLDDFQAGAVKKVIAEKDGDKFVFKGKSGKEAEWIAQLKPSHAQRIAHDIGTSFSRVGVLEAEWLRLKADRQLNTVDEDV